MSFHRLLTVAALAGFVTALAGCGTLIGRQSGHVDIFPRLQQDGAFLGVTNVNEPYNPSAAATIFLLHDDCLCAGNTAFNTGRRSNRYGAATD